MSDVSNEFDLDTAVEADTPGEEWGGPVEADDEFQVEDVETQSNETEGEGEDGSAPAKPSKKKGPGYGEIPTSEFEFDATPRPRVAGDKKDDDGKPKQTKDTLPDGWTTPTGLVNLLRERRIVDLKPQAMYGWVKNGKGFPWKFHTDGRYIVPIEDEAAAGHTFNTGEKAFTQSEPKGGLTWVREQLEKRKEREQARVKAAADQAAQEDAEPSAPATDTTPVVGGVEEVASFES